MPIFTKDPTVKVIKSEFSEIYQNAMGIDIDSSAAMSSAMEMSPMGQLDIFEELLPGDEPDSVNKILTNQYELVYPISP